jgi:hypothetical protein
MRKKTNSSIECDNLLPRALPFPHAPTVSLETTSSQPKSAKRPLPRERDGSNVSVKMAAAELSAVYRAMQKSAARFSNYNVRE